MRKQDDFVTISNKMAFDVNHREKMHLHMLSYNQAFAIAKLQFSNLELSRNRASYLKWKTTENLDKYLIEFESNVIKKGGKVLWADDAAGALHEIEAIIKKHNCTHVVKSQSLIANELNLTTHLRNKRIEVAELEIGEFIIDQAQEKPYHYINPSLNKNIDSILSLLNDKLSTSLNAEAIEIADDIRTELRMQIKQSTIGITGANFIVSDSGMVGISENDGSAFVCSALPKVHIVLTGIENVIPSINDAELFFSLYSTYSTGQKLTSFNMLTGPKTPGDIDGPSEFYVILLDNGRSNVLAHQEQREAMGCIKCAACLNTCPVYNTIGAYAYSTNEYGPIGQVIAPLQYGMDEYKHLSFANPLSGSGSKICPIKIDLDNHLLRNRKESVHQGLVKNGEKLMWYSWKKIMLSRKNMNKGTSIKGFMLKSFFKSGWGERREFPKLADKSFNQLWRERFGQ